MPPSDFRKRGLTRLASCACAVLTVAIVAFPRTAMSTPLMLATPVTPHYSGQEIFRAVLFGDGAVAKQLNSTKAKVMSANFAQLTANQIMVVRAAEDTAIARVAAADPAFFGRYAVEMQSGDPLRITAAMDQGRRLLMKVFEHEKPSIRTDDSQRGCLLLVFAVGVVVINVAAAINIDIVANAVTAYNVVTYKNAVCVSEEFAAMEEPSPDNALYRDQVVSQIALRLAVAQ